jgi:PAS domain-containing protein
MQSSSSPSPDRPLERELLRRFLQASRRSQILALVSAAQAEDELAELVVTELCEAFEAEIALVLVTLPDGDAQVLGSAGVPAGDRDRLRDAAPRAALRARVPHVQLGADLLGLGARSLVSAPFVAPGEERGAIVLACLDERHFDDADLSLVESVAVSFGDALTRLRHADELERQAARLHARFEHAPVALVVVGPGLEILDANAAACALLARERSALLRLLLSELPDRIDVQFAPTAEASGSERVVVLRDPSETPNVLHAVGIGPGVPTPL